MRPIVGFVILILVGIGIASYTANMRPSTASLTPQEQAEEEMRKEMEEARKNQALLEKKKTDPTRLNAFDAVEEGAVRATLEVEGKGTMTLELYPKAAPRTVAHFVDLCKKNFYEGILFHRVEPGFVAQAGDPESKKVDAEKIRGIPSREAGEKYNLGSGGSGQKVPLEVKLPHLPYSIGLARSREPDSGDSQFYLNLRDNIELDTGYCVFGRIVSGEEVAKKIEQGDKIKRLSVP